MTPPKGKRISGDSCGERGLSFIVTALRRTEMASVSCEVNTAH